MLVMILWIFTDKIVRWLFQWSKSRNMLKKRQMAFKNKYRPTSTKDVTRWALPIAKLEKIQHTFEDYQFLKLKNFVCCQRLSYIVRVCLLLSLEKCHTLVYGEAINRNSLKIFPERCYKINSKTPVLKFFRKKVPIDYNFIEKETSTNVL